MHTKYTMHASTPLISSECKGEKEQATHVMEKTCISTQTLSQTEHIHPSLSMHTHILDFLYPLRFEEARVYTAPEIPAPVPFQWTAVRCPASARPQLGLRGSPAIRELGTVAGDRRQARPAAGVGTRLPAPEQPAQTQTQTREYLKAIQGQQAGSNPQSAGRDRSMQVLAPAPVPPAPHPALLQAVAVTAGTSPPGRRVRRFKNLHEAGRFRTVDRAVVDDRRSEHETEE